MLKQLMYFLYVKQRLETTSAQNISSLAQQQQRSWLIVTFSKNSAVLRMHIWSLTGTAWSTSRRLNAAAESIKTHMSRESLRLSGAAPRARKQLFAATDDTAPGLVTCRWNTHMLSVQVLAFTAKMTGRETFLTQPKVTFAYSHRKEQCYRHCELWRKE